MNTEQMIQCALEENFTAAAVVDTSEIVFDSSFRTYCEENLCGQYGANYSCPPDCGTPDEMKARILAHKKALVLKSAWDILDYTDVKAIKYAKGKHNDGEQRLMKLFREAGVDGFMVGSSGCALCNPCAKMTGDVCKFPELRYSCMSAYCILVKDLAEKCGMEYTWKGDKMELYGMYVFDE